MCVRIKFYLSQTAYDNDKDICISPTSTTTAITPVTEQMVLGTFRPSIQIS